MNNLLYSVFSWLYKFFTNFLPGQHAVNPNEQLVRQQIEELHLANDNIPLKNLIVDIVLRLPSLSSSSSIAHNNNQQQQQLNNSSVQQPLGNEDIIHNNDIPLVHNLLPNLFNGTYQQAINQCKNQDKLLLVYLHSPENDQTNEFLQEIFCKFEFIEFINNEFIVYANSIKEREGYIKSNEFGCTAFPFLCVVFPQDGKEYWRMDGLNELKAQLLLNNNNVVNDNATIGVDRHLIDIVLTQLIEVHERLEAQLVVHRTTRQQREFERSAREEQDRAYEESLRKDREKEEQRIREENKKLEMINQFKRKIEENERKRIEIQQNVVFYNGNESNSKLVKFKLPNGTETQFRFNSDLSFANLHQFIHSYSFKEWKPSRYSKLESDYELTLNVIPKRILPYDENEKLSSIAGKGFIIYVREAEHDEEEEFAQQHGV
ncbi:hypothetical protein ABK040_004804 [Willaertia magna]